ncbi:MAG: heme NO-binding domain-containing protein [Saprospiraceae bacterium]|nr:heme NO-binding domain-containing protein [Saprospiraceae bacterium]
MKGIVFTEFLDMVEEKFGYEVVDQIIEDAQLESKGVYTSVGTYKHSEIVQLLMNLSDTVKVDPNVLLKEFGIYLFDTFLKTYPTFFTSVDNAFDFLESIDKHIHVEVLKLYPDATLPKFLSERFDDNSMIMTYISDRKMSALAHGLIERSIKHYREDYSLEIENISEDGSKVKFIIKNNS